MHKCCRRKSPSLLLVRHVLVDPHSANRGIWQVTVIMAASEHVSLCNGTLLPLPSRLHPWSLCLHTTWIWAGLLTLLWPLEYGGCDGVWFLSLGLKGSSNLLEPWGCYAVRKPRLTGGGELEKQATCWSGRPGGTSLAVTADGGSEQGRGKATGQLGICQRSQEAVKVKWKVKVAQSCPTLCNSTDYTVHGILQARILEWVAVPFSKGSSQPRDRTQVSCNAGRFLTSWATRKQGTHKWKETALVPMEKKSKWSGQKIQSARILPQGKASSRARPCLSSILGRLRQVRKLQKKWRNVWG